MMLIKTVRKDVACSCGWNLHCTTPRCCVLAVMFLIWTDCDDVAYSCCGSLTRHSSVDTSRWRCTTPRCCVLAVMFLIWTDCDDVAYSCCGSLTRHSSVDTSRWRCTTHRCCGRGLVLLPSPSRLPSELLTGKALRRVKSQWPSSHRQAWVTVLLAILWM